MKTSKVFDGTIIGLTPSKLILATDKLIPARESSTTCLPGLDPDIETFELIAVYPVQCVNLSVFHRRKQKSLKARFCNNRVLYFELGGFEKRNVSDCLLVLCAVWHLRLFP